MRFKRILMTAFAASICAPAQAATTLTFQQGVNGYLGTSDTYLRSADADFSYGSDTTASIDASDSGGPSQALLRFGDLFGAGSGQIKAGDQIVSAKLTLNIDSSGSGVNFHDMLVSWSQNTATWNSVGNGIQANGIEAAATPFLSVGANDSGTNIVEGIFEVDVTDAIKAAKAGTVPGYGWALLPFMPDGTNGVDFFTSEESFAALRPVLTVEIQPVPEPETYALLLAGLGLVGWVARRRSRTELSIEP